MEKIRGLYKITNEYSGLFYIGKSVDIYKRWITHKKDFENGTHSGGAFQYDYDVFGKEAFKFEILYDDENVTPFFSMFTSNDVWIRYDKKRMIVSILDKSIIPDIVTPDDIFYHTESLI